MPRITDEKQQENLLRNNLEIQTKYLDDEQFIVKSTKEENNDSRNVRDGIILEKMFFYDNLPLMKSKGYDSRVHYCFLTAADESETISCPNCGNTSLGKDFLDGCPYCGTFYNMDYKDKKLGTKHYYDYVMKNEKYLWITLLIDVLFSFGASFLYVLLRGRTFNIYDIGKCCIWGLLLSVLLFVVFYYMDAFVVLYPVRNFKEKQNRKQQDFWEQFAAHGYDRNKLMNDFHMELREELYAEEDVIDYDIIDFDTYELLEEDGHKKIKLSYEIRIFRYKENKIEQRREKKTTVLTYQDIPISETKEGINMIMCPNCGASVRLSDGVCSHCDYRIKPFQRWIM